MALKLHSVVVVGVCVLGLAACKRDEAHREGGVLGDRTVSTDRDRTDRTTLGTDDSDKRVGETTVTGANIGAVPNESAINRIIAARCAREAACNNVGSDKHFTSHDVCAKELRSKMRDDLNANECPRGVHAKELDECMESIRKESCNNPIDAISRLAACRTSDLCLKIDDKNR